jgi:hypothetical protein
MHLNMQARVSQFAVCVNVYFTVRYMFASHTTNVQDHD